MKKIIIAGIVLVIAIGAGAYYLLSNLNSLVASAIEKHGSEVTATSVSVSGVDISLGEGRGSISGLRVASPEGFHVRDAFSLGDITIDLDVSSVREDPVVIDVLRIRQPVVAAEVLGDGSSNIEELRKRVQAYSASGSGSQEAGPRKKLRIKRFVLEEGRIEADASELGIEKRTLTLPAIRMDNVGGESGAPPDQIAKVILTAVARETASRIANSEIHRLIEDQLDESVADKAKDLIDKIGN